MSAEAYCAARLACPLCGEITDIFCPVSEARHMKRICVGMHRQQCPVLLAGEDDT